MKRETTRKKAKAGRPAADPDISAIVKGLGDGCVEMSYARKDVVFRQGDIADSVFYILKGKIQISVVSEHGKEGVIAMLGAGEFFGQGCLAGQPVHLSSATVLDDAVVCRVDRKVMVGALHTQVVFAEAFTGFLLSRTIQIEADLIDQLFNSSEKRLARTLLLLANFGHDGQMEMTIPKVNQDVLAARVGTTRSRINFFMNKFRKLGFIKYNGGIEVHTSLLNAILHDLPHQSAHARGPQDA